MVCQTIDAAEQAVWHSLNNFAYENAAFLAERLHAEIGNENSLSLLATCYFRSGDIAHAYALLSKCIGAPQYRLNTPRAKFLLAKCCFVLEKFAEGEDALIGRSPAFPNSTTLMTSQSGGGGLNSSTANVSTTGSTIMATGSNATGDPINNPDLLSSFGDIESFAYELLANICMRTSRPERAKRFLERAIAVNPLLWSAYSQLCDMGAVKPGQAGTILRQLNNQPAVAAAINLSPPATQMSEFGALQLQLQTIKQQQHLATTQSHSPKLSNFTATTAGGQLQQMEVDNSCSAPQQQQQQQQPPAPATTAHSAPSKRPSATSAAAHRHVAPAAPAKRVPFRSRVTAAPRRTGGDSNVAMLTVPSGSTSSISSVGSGGSSVVVTSSRQILASVNPSSGVGNTAGSAAPRRSQRLKENNRSQVTGSDASSQASSSASTAGSGSNRLGRLRPSTTGSSSSNNNSSTTAPPATTTTGSSLTSTTGSARTRQLRMTDNENLKSRHGSGQQSSSSNKSTRDPLGSLHQRIETISDSSKDSSAEIVGNIQQTVNKQEPVVPSNKAPSTMSSQHSPSMVSEDSHRDTSALSISVQWKTLSTILPVISRLGSAYAALTSYACHRALNELDVIPSKHAKTPFVASLVARAHYEAGQFENAVEIYAELHRMDPAWLSGMDRYSSALWRLQRVNDLVHLALNLERVQPLRSQTWLAIGNAMSLEKERARAIRSFDRAVQLDDDKRSHSSYAHILAGYEHLLGDDFDRAEVRFRKAFACDPRNYAALVGLGQLQYKRKQYHDAVVSLDRAVQINPGNVTIYTQLALVLHALHHDHSALLAIDRALVLKPKDPSALFNRARIFYCMRQHRDALRVLAELKSVAPREAMAYMLQGKVYEALGDTAQAQLSFIWASQLTAGSAMAVQVRELVCHTAPPPVPLAGVGGSSVGASSSSAVPIADASAGGASSHLNSSIPVASSSGTMLTGSSATDSFDLSSVGGGHRFSSGGPPTSLVAAMALPGESFTVTMGVNDSAIVGGTLGGSDSFLSAAFGGGHAPSGSDAAGSSGRDLMQDGDDEDDEDDDAHDDEDDDEDMFNNNDDDTYEDDIEHSSSLAMQDARGDASFESALAAIAGEEEGERISIVSGEEADRLTPGIVSGGVFNDTDDPMTGPSSAVDRVPSSEPAAGNESDTDLVTL